MPDFQSGRRGFESRRPFQAPILINGLIGQTLNLEMWVRIPLGAPSEDFMYWIGLFTGLCFGIFVSGALPEIFKWFKRIRDPKKEVLFKSVKDDDYHFEIIRIVNRNTNEAHIRYEFYRNNIWRFGSVYRNWSDIINDERDPEKIVATVVGRIRKIFKDYTVRDKAREDRKKMLNGNWEKYDFLNSMTDEEIEPHTTDNPNSPFGPDSPFSQTIGTASPQLISQHSQNHFLGEALKTRDKVLRESIERHQLELLNDGMK